MRAPAPTAPEAADVARPESRTARRKRATEARLLDAALRVFCERGYDAATTGEIARVADVAAGTFYVHFRDKRSIFESLARRSAHELLEQWRAALGAEMRSAERVAIALRLAADYWRSDLDRARLLLEGGPSLGSEGHVRFIDEVAPVFADAPDLRGLGAERAQALALIAVGLGIELGRVIVGRPESQRESEELVALMAKSLAKLDRGA